MSNAAGPYRILDDGRLDLPEVTLFAASSRALAATTRALQKCLSQIRPAEALLFSDVRPEEIDTRGLRLVRTCRMDSRADYSRFILKELASHVTTDFVLCVQWDGYVLNARNWSEHFLSVDYIGAPWPHYDDGHTVGNGGFSLRSKRLLDACADARIGGNEVEDVAICRTARPWLESDYGIRFANPELARRFSYERTPARGDEFGFHGVFNMMDILPGSEYRAIVASLEPGVLRQSDKFELLRGALKRRDFGTAWMLVNSMMADGLIGLLRRWRRDSQPLRNVGIHGEETR